MLRQSTTTEDVVGVSGIGLIVAGWPGFLVGFASHNDTLTGASFAGIVAGTILAWWAVGAFEEAEIPGSRVVRCQKKRRNQ